MRPESIPKLSDVLREYVPEEELEALCDSLDVPVEYDSQDRPRYGALAKALVTETEHGNNHRLLKTLLDTASRRAQDMAAHSEWERRSYHERMQGEVAELERELEAAGLPTEIDVDEGRPFRAKSEVRELLAQAETTVTVVDNYVGGSTLDCLREVSEPIRLLTGSGSKSLSSDFCRVLAEFVAEGMRIEVRQHPKLHDRYLLFNDRCYLVGSSLKDAGKKRLNIVECVDSRPSIQEDVEAKWADASPLA